MELIKRATPAIVILLLCSPFLALLTAPVEADPGTVRVPQNFPTVQQAIDASSSGGTILVSPGTYQENITVWKPLTITGEKKDTTIIEQPGAFAVCYITAERVNFTGFTIRGGSIGIWIDTSDFCKIADNIVTDNDDGIWTTFSLETILTNNIITDNVFMGLYLSASNTTTVRDNVMANNTYGVYMENAVNNAIYENAICLNYADGVDAINSQHNSIFHNMISNNSLGIYLEGSTTNSVYENNIVDNLEQAWVEETTANSWDDGYKGNHWSDYTGIDSNGDGIGDTPYVINQNNQDRYPLMKPWTNIAVSDAPPSKRYAAQGVTLHMRLSVENQGWNDEKTNITVYADTTLVATLTNIVLTSRNSTIITFTWNTTGFAKGNHTITAYAAPVSGETNTADNTFIGWIIITIPGDVNGDGIVDIFDAITLAGAFNSVPSSLNWNPNVDINDDSIVDIFDAIILAGNFNRRN